MKKATSRRTPEPSKASLHALPEVDVARYRARRNPYAERIARDGLEVVHDGPSAASLAALPEADPAAPARRNPHARRAAESLARLQYGRGRPRRGREVGTTTTRSIRLPAPVWEALEAEATRTGTTVHALLRRAVAEYLAAVVRGSSE